MAGREQNRGLRYDRGLPDSSEVFRMPLRFNHMELTLPPGTLAREGESIRSFYREVFGIDAMEVPLFDQTGLLMHTDPEVSQFILLMEMENHMRSPGYDHLGFLMDSREQVDAALASCRSWQSRDPRVEIKEYEDLVIAPTTTHAFYVRYLLPIWFDVQVIEYEAGQEPASRWEYHARKS
jgi:hypothetical protein